MTPLLIFFNIPPAVAVASSTNQIIASSFSGFLSHFKRRNIDFQIGTIFVMGGITGSTAGVILFRILQYLGQIDLVISMIYILVLGSISILMVVESVNKIIAKNKILTSPSSDLTKNTKEKTKNRIKNLLQICHTKLIFHAQRSG